MVSGCDWGEAGVEIRRTVSRVVYKLKRWRNIQKRGRLDFADKHTDFTIALVEWAYLDFTSMVCANGCKLLGKPDH